MAKTPSLPPVNLWGGNKPKTSASPPPPPPQETKTFCLGDIGERQSQRIGIYGPGGIGKTSLACCAPGPVAVIDLDESLPVLKPLLFPLGLSIKTLDGIDSWNDMRAALHQPIWDDVQTIVVDSVTRAEQLAIKHTISTVLTEKGAKVDSIEGYGFGKGYRHVYETFIALFADLDVHVKAGRNIILIAHDCTANVPNPDGVDFIRWEPRLQNKDSGNIRYCLKEWVDHLFCIRYDVSTSKDGKATGQGTRTIYTNELPTHMAKSRSMKNNVVFQEHDALLWSQLFPALYASK